MSFNYVGQAPLEGDSGERYFYALRRDDDGQLFIQKVDIASPTDEAQINRPGGFGELFAVSLSNVPTNIFVANDNNFKVLGFFNVSAVHGLGNTLDDEELEKIELYNREW